MAAGEQSGPRSSQLPSQVQVTVRADGRDRAFAVAPAVAIAVLAAVLAAAAVITIVTVLLPAERAPAPRPVPALAHEPGPAGVAAAYGFPLRCLTITTLPGNPEYARADFNRASECGRYNGAVTAIFLRSGGVWRPVLRAVLYSCPVRSLPPSVQAGLDVCAAPGSHRYPVGGPGPA